MKSYQAEIASFLQRHNWPITSKNIAFAVGCSVQTVRRHLRPLISSREVSKRPYWLGQNRYTWVYFWRGCTFEKRRQDS